MTIGRAITSAAVVAHLLGATPAEGQDVRIGGLVRLDRRVSLADSLRLADFYNVFRPQLSAGFDGRAEVVVSLDMRFFDFAEGRSTEELTDAERHFPSTVTVWEAFVRVSEFLVEPVDLTIGKQRVQWGAADGLNPTDRFNAYDLSDLTDFTLRVPVWAVRGEYYASPGWRIEGVWTPTAHGPILPPGLDALLAGGDRDAPPGPVTSWNGHFEPPTGHPRNSQFGFRVAGRMAGLDLSASYFNGFDGIPLVRAMTFMNSDTSPAGPSYDAHLWSVLPRLQVLGADAATEWNGVGLWAEAAVVLPQEIDVVTVVIAGSDSVRDRAAATDGVPYGTWIVGGDYRLRGGWYLNLQWAHGFFLERGTSQLHDYLVGKLEHRLMREAVAVSVEGIVELARWSDWSDHAGYGVSPEVAYAPVDNIDVSLGALVAGGRGDALFSRLADVDQLYLRVQASF